MELFEDEKIKEIENFPGYFVTNYGRIWSNFSRKWLKPTENKRGNHNRLYVSLGRGNKRYVHRLVAETFIPNPENLNEVDHIDTNGLNNRVENLRWVTHNENMVNEKTVENLKRNTGHYLEIEEIATGKKFIGVKEVAKIFQVSENTVTNHIKNKVKNPCWRTNGERIKPN